MPEEVNTPSTTPAIERPEPDFSLMRASDKALLRPLIQIPIGGGIIAIGLYLVLTLQTGAWQLLAEAGLIVVGIAFGLLANRLIKQDRFHAAGYSLIFGFAIVYGGAEAILIGLTTQIVIGGSLLIILTGSILLPGQWKKILSIGAVYLAYIWLIDRFNFLPRYDTSGLVIFSLVITGITITLGMAVFWRFAQMFPTYSLRTKLTIAFLVVSLASVGVVTFYADRTLRATVQDRASAQLTNVAQLRGTAVGDLFAEEVKLLQTLALSEQIRSEAETSDASYQGTEADTQAALMKLDQTWRAAADANDHTDPLVKAKLTNTVAEYLRQYRALYPENAEVFVTDLHGALLGATNRTSDYYQADEDWWQAAYSRGAGAIYYSQPTYDESSGTFSVNIALPVYDPSGTKMVGILRTTVDLAAETASVVKAQFGTAGLLLPNNTRVTELGPVPVSSDVLAQLPTTAGTTAEMDWEGQPSFVAVAPVSASDPKLGISIGQLRWKVLAHQPRTEILAPVEAQTSTVLLVFAVIAIIVTGASVGLSQILVRPIAHLTAAAKKVATGDLTGQAPVESSDEIGTLAMTFNTMTNQLRTMVGTLEERVQARTDQLRVSAEVGRFAAAILNQDRLLHEIVNLITDRFGFYYAAVFTLDETGQRALLREATGEAGQTLKERGHQLPVDETSMVGYAIVQRKARIALDVGADSVRFANPLLRETRSEIALPLIVGNRAIGALDVQATTASAFDETNAVTLQAMADQIAIALNNATLFNQVERQVEVQANINQLNRSLFAATTLEEFYQVLARMLNNLVSHDYLGLTLASGTSTSLREYILHAQTEPVISEGSVWSTTNTLYGRCFTTRQPVISNDLAQDALMPDMALLERAGFHSALILPLAVGDRVLGTLNFASVRPSAFSLQGSAQLEQIASQVAVALETQRLAQAQQNSLREMEALTRQLTGQTWAKRLTGQEQRVQYARSGLPTQQVRQLPEMKTAIEQLKTIAWSKQDDSANPSPYTATLAAPILLRGEVLGALQVGEANQAREWSEDDITFIQAVADQVALALDNARLLEETEKRAQRERLVAEVSSRMFASNDMETIVQIAGEELGRVLRVGRAEIKIDPNLTTTPLPELAQPNGNGQSADWQTGGGDDE